MLFALMNGEHVNGTQQYITLLGIHFPLLALSPYVLIVALAGLLTKQKNKHNWSVQWAVYVSPALVLYLLSFRITEFVFFFIVALALFMFTYRNKAIAVLAPLVHVFVIPALLLLFNGSFLQPGFRQRVSNFFNLDPYEGMVNPVVQSLDIIREAGWFGNGIGAPLTNMSLYYIHSDWIYTYMIFALGWAGGLAVLWTVAALLYRILQAAVTVKDPFGKYMIKGLGLLLGLKFVWSIAMTIGWLPFTSVQFPLIAFGGSSMFADMIALGFMMGIYRRKDMIIVSKEQRIVS
jgi:cell division protein FtsW (lipid II flippase)